MAGIGPVASIPVYHGQEWIESRLPTAAEAWPKFETRALVRMSGDDYDLAREEIRHYGRGKPWVWPAQHLYFLCDQHADTDAFLGSLVATGGVAKTGAGDDDFELTPEGARARFIIGGDCIDKGPDNLRLLRVLRTFLDRAPRVELLAGNHDLRLLVGLVEGGHRDVLRSHLFIRLGQKSVPLFEEVYREFIAGGEPGALLSDDEVREQLFPEESWYEEFPLAAAGRVPAERIAREVWRIREKSAEFVARCERDGFTLGAIHAAYEKTRELFLSEDGEFSWFFRDMKLAHRDGSFLFIHAGVDDFIARCIRDRGIDGLNEEFARLREVDLFQLYNGSVGNTFRTKYRTDDRPLTPDGVGDMHKAGIYAIVHGHQAILRGQRVLMRSGLLNFECDASVDRNTRQLRGLPGIGAAAMIFRPEGEVLAISTDYPYVKVLDAIALLHMTSLA